MSRINSRRKTAKYFETFFSIPKEKKQRIIPVKPTNRIVYSPDTGSIFLARLHHYKGVESVQKQRTKNVRDKSCFILLGHKERRGVVDR